MATRIEFYKQLREHIPDEAARLIAEETKVEARFSASWTYLTRKSA